MPGMVSPQASMRALSKAPANSDNGSIRLGRTIWPGHEAGYITVCPSPSDGARAAPLWAGRLESASNMVGRDIVALLVRGAATSRTTFWQDENPLCGFGRARDVLDSLGLELVQLVHQKIPM